MRARVTILERNAAAAARMARAASAATGMSEVRVVTSVAAAAQTAPTLLGMDLQDLAFVRACPELAQTPCVVWAQEQTAQGLEAVAADPQVGALLGWPSFLSAPRPWELTLALRQTAMGARCVVPNARELVAHGASSLDWRVASTLDRDETVEAVTRFAQPVAGRLAEKVALATHELLMNALYDAPVGPGGAPRFAHSRAQDIVLSPEEAATCRVASDGHLLTVEVVDPFGGLQRHQVYKGVARGINGARATSAVYALDTTHGGAGLGLHRIFEAGVSTIIHVTPKVETRVCAVFDLSLSQRELRGIPGSLHFFNQE